MRINIITNFTRYARQLAKKAPTESNIPLAYHGILAESPLLMLPTDPDELANLLHNLSYDWAVDLDFIDRVARARGIEVDTVLVSQKVRDMIGEE